MIPYFGDFAEDASVYIPFNTFSSDDPAASVTITNLADADIKVHKDGSVTQIVTDGATIAIDFDSITGGHLITVDTSAHADYATGSDYLVRIEGTTVDGATINAFVGSFSIENRFMRGTDLAALATALTTAQNDLDTLTGSDGVTLATTQGNYAPAKVADLGTVQTADHTAAIADIPTVSEFNARTLAAADYFDPTADTVANVTTVATTTTNTDMRGTDSANTTTPPTVGAIADQVWLEAIADHSGTSGSTAEALNAAGAAGDPWTTALPGAYGAGSAGKIIGDNINAPLDTIDTVVDAIKAKTDGLNFTGFSVDAQVTGMEEDTVTATALEDSAGELIADYVLDEATAGHTTAGTLGKAVIDTLADTNELQTNQGSWLTATGFSTHDAAAVVTALGTGTTLTACATATGFNTTTPPTVAAIADGVWDELQSGHTDAGSFGLYVDQTISTAGGGGLTEAGIADAVWDELQAGHTDAGSFGLYVDSVISLIGGSAGAGGTEQEFTIEASGTPVSGVECWVTTDEAGNNVVAGTLVTDNFGVVTFMLDSGTYWLWRESGTHSFTTNPTSFTVA